MGWGTSRFFTGLSMEKFPRLKLTGVGLVTKGQDAYVLATCSTCGLVIVSFMECGVLVGPLVQACWWFVRRRF